MQLTIRNTKVRNDRGQMVNATFLGAGSIAEEVSSWLENNPDAITDGAVQGVTDWLEENITQPTTPVIDASLSVSGAAADAKKTGDELETLKNTLLVPRNPFDWAEEATTTSPLGWHTGYYKASNGTVANSTSAMRTVGTYYPDSSIKLFVIEVPAGYNVAVYEYDGNGVYVKNYGVLGISGDTGVSKLSVCATDGYGYKFAVAVFTDSSEYITENFIGNIVLTPYTVVHEDLIGSEELETDSKTLTGAINEIFQSQAQSSSVEGHCINWRDYSTNSYPLGWARGYYSSTDGYPSSGGNYIRTLRTNLYAPTNVDHFTITAPEGYYVSVCELGADRTFIKFYGSANSDSESCTNELTVSHTNGHQYGFTIGKFTGTEDVQSHLANEEFIDSIILTPYVSTSNLVVDSSFAWSDIGSLTNPTGWTTGYRDAQTGAVVESDQYLRTVGYRYCPNDLVQYFGVNAPYITSEVRAIAVFEYDENNNFVKKHGEMDSTSADATTNVIVKHTKGHKYSFCVGKFASGAASTVLNDLLDLSKLDAVKIDDHGFKAKEERKNHLNIMIFGNSYAADSWGYVPFILKKYGITTNIYIYYRGSGSIDRLVAEWESNSLTGLDAWGQSHVRRVAHIDTRYTDQWDSVASGYSAKNVLEFANDPTKQIDQWDIISLQQGGRQNAFTVAPGAPDPRVGTEPYLRQAIALINASYDKPYNLAWFATYSAIKPYAGDESQGYPAVSGESLDNRVNTLKAAETIYHAEPFNIIFPVCAAIYSARTNPVLASTDVSAIGNYWCPDAVHLDAGIPSYTASCTIIQSIFNKFFPGLSILNDDTVVTDALISSWSCKFVGSWQGSVRSTREDLYALARKCAINACNNPFDIVPVYLPSDTTDLVMFDEHTNRYWADALIDTSHIVNGEYVE